MQTLIRLLLREQSDQGQHCLQSGSFRCITAFIAQMVQFFTTFVVLQWTLFTRTAFVPKHFDVKLNLLS